VALQRVVITGRGSVSPYGPGVQTLLDGIWQGHSCIKLMPEWQEVNGLESTLAAPLPPIDAKSLLPRSARRTMGPMALYATLASQEAIEDAGLPEKMIDSGSVGVAIGSTTGSPLIYEEFYRQFIPDKNIEEVRSGLFFKLMGHSCAANVCLALGINGEQWAPSSACASAAQAIGLGYLLIQTGRQSAMLCGGSDEVHPTVTMVFDVVKAASRKIQPPLTTPRPFDRDRDGVVCGEGSGILVLESLESAQERGAHIYAEIAGFGHVSDSSHIANPGEEAMALAMNNALADAKIDKSLVDYVNCHATGTILGDVAEAKAVHSAVGSKVPISSLKGHFGHALGAAGSLETIVLLEMMAREEIIPTLHLDNPDPACEVARLVQEIEPCRLNTVIKNNFALGGVNAALILKRKPE